MQVELSAKVLRYRWLIFLVLALAYFFVYFHRLSLSVVANDLVNAFQTTASVMGLLGSIYFYCYAAMQIPAGLATDRLGRRRVLIAALIGYTATSLGYATAASPSWC